MMYEHLYQVPFITIFNGSVQDYKLPIDSILVSNCKFLLSEIDMRERIWYSRPWLVCFQYSAEVKFYKHCVDFSFSLFGEKFLRRLRDFIVQNYMGEMALYNAFIVETNHSTVKYPYALK
jgi:hypothetical protein